MKTVYWHMLTYVVNKGMVVRRWALWARAGGGVVRRRGLGGYATRGSSGSRVSSSTISYTMMSRTYRFCLAPKLQLQLRAHWRDAAVAASQPNRSALPAHAHARATRADGPQVVRLMHASGDLMELV